MIPTCLRAVIFPDGCLLSVGIPLVLTALLPSEQARFMLPLVWTPSKHQCILFPDAAAGKVEPGILKCFSEIQSFRIRMENINGSILFHRLLHVDKCCEQEFIEIFIRHIVIFYLSGCLLNIYIIWWIRQHKVCFPAVHQCIVSLRQNGITADDTVLSEQPHITRLCNGRFCKLCFHIEIIFRDLLIMHGIEKLLYLRWFKTRDTDIKIGILKVFDKICQKFLIPFARDLIKGNIEGLFLGLVDIDHDTLHFRISEV